MTKVSLFLVFNDIHFFAVMREVGPVLVIPIQSLIIWFLNGQLRLPTDNT